MAISAKDVKKLRDITNAGMMDCKKALESSNGDIEQALKILKEKGLADAKKRGDRETKEGGVYIAEVNGNIGMILIGSETDFVSKNDVFIKAANDIAAKVAQTKNSDITAYTADIQDVIQQTKENVELKSVKYVDVRDNQAASVYIHGNNKIGVVVVFELGDASSKENASFKEAANNIAMHIAANAPLYLSKDDVPKNEMDEQREVFKKQLEDSGKPENVLENILNGKLNKHFAEMCLLDQKYIKDDKITVSQYIEDTAKQLGASLKLVSFERENVGV